MTQRDLHNNIHVVSVIPPISVSDNTAQVGAIIDTLGYNSLEFAINIGSVADSDATFTVLVEDGDSYTAPSTLSDAAAVDDAYLLGLETQASFQFDSDNTVRKIGYVGNKRYVRLTITPASNSSAAVFGVVGLLGHPFTAAVSNP